jgi:hypothetical protein
LPRAAASIAPDAIRIEDEVWQEAFDQRAPRRRRSEPTRRAAPARRPAASRQAEAALPEIGEIGRPRLAVATRPPAAEAPPPPQAEARIFDGQALEPEPAISMAVESARSDEPLGRRTVVIKGRGAERNLPWESGISARRSSRLPHHRHTFRPDRLAMWAMLLGLLLVLVAAMSAH